MSRNPNNLLRPLLEQERHQLMRLSRGTSPCGQPSGPCESGAGGRGWPHLHRCGPGGGYRELGDAVAALVARFNVEGLVAAV